MTDLAELDATAADVVLARLEALETAASALVESQVRPNTRRAFTADWASWCRFCAGEGIDPLTVSPGLLVAFATWLAHALPDRPAMSPATITRQLSGVLNGWRRAGLTVPRGITSEARKIIAGYQRNLRREDLPVGRGASPALTIRDLRRISATCPATLIGARNRAMLVLGFSIAARRSELAELLVSDIADDPNGLIVTIRDSKTGLRQPVVPPGTDELTCAVRTWHAWLKASGITSGRAFRNITRHGKLGDRPQRLQSLPLEGAPAPPTFGQVRRHSVALAGPADVRPFISKWAFAVSAHDSVTGAEVPVRVGQVTAAAHGEVSGCGLGASVAPEAFQFNFGDSHVSSTIHRRHRHQRSTGSSPSSPAASTASAHSSFCSVVSWRPSSLSSSRYANVVTGSSGLAMRYSSPRRYPHRYTGNPTTRPPTPKPAANPAAASTKKMSISLTRDEIRRAATNTLDSRYRFILDVKVTTDSAHST